MFCTSLVSMHFHFILDLTLFHVVLKHSTVLYFIMANIFQVNVSSLIDSIQPLDRFTFFCKPWNVSNQVELLFLVFCDHKVVKKKVKIFSVCNKRKFNSKIKDDLKPMRIESMFFCKFIFLLCIIIKEEIPSTIFLFYCVPSLTQLIITFYCFFNPRVQNNKASMIIFHLYDAVKNSCTTKKAFFSSHDEP